MPGHGSQHHNESRRALTRGADAHGLPTEIAQLISVALQNNHTMVAVTDPAGKLLYVNPRFLNVMGYQAGEVLGEEVITLTQPETDADVDDLQQSLQDGNEWWGETRARTKDGGKIWVAVSIYPIKNSDGQVTHLLGLGEEITSRKEAELALQESLERMRAFANAMPDIAFILDEDGVYVEVLAVREKSGLLYADAEALKGRRLSEVLPKDDADLFLSVVRRTIETSEPQTLEYKLDVLTGTHWFEGRTAPLQVTGDKRMVVWVSREITDQKFAQDSLRRSEEQYRLLYQHNPSMYFTVDGSGTVLSVNRFGASQLGYASAELVGRSVLDVFHPDDRDDVQRQLHSCMKSSGKVFEWEFRKVRKDGKVIWVEERARAVLGPDGQTIVLIVCEDITQRRESELALSDSEARFRGVVEVLPDLLLRISRDGTYLDVIPAKDFPPRMPADQLLGKKLLDALPEEVALRGMQHIQAALKSGTVETFEYSLSEGGDTRHYEARIAPSGDDEVVVVVRDVTSRRHLEEAIQSRREEVESNAEIQMERGNPYGLTFREFTVLNLIADGRLDKEIGTILGISNRTANKHVENILSKMHAPSRTEASVRAVREKLIS